MNREALENFPWTSDSQRMFGYVHYLLVITDKDLCVQQLHQPIILMCMSCLQVCPFLSVWDFNDEASSFGEEREGK